MITNKLMGGASASPSDPQFNYVTMLLHGDGTNGGQNNTFVDSSSNNFSITRNGNTTQGTFSPYGPNWSNYFGTSDSIYFPSNASYGVGTGNFTVEFWVSPSVFGSNELRYFLLGQSGSNRITIENDSNGALNVCVGSNSASISYSWSPTLGNWYHLAVVRSGTTVTLYINGTSVATATNGNSVAASTLFVGGLNWASGYGAQAYISNLRFTNTAVYTSNFTPSTTPLTAISGTLLLTCQSNRFVDNSSIGATALVGNGTPSVQRFSPFAPSTAYSTSVIGGSGYFDGSGDYLTGTGSSNLAFGSGDFTVELWVYFNSVTSPPAYQFIYSSADSSVASGVVVIYWYETSSSLRFNNGGDVFSIAGIQAKTWYHVAICRSGSTTKMFLNGLQVGSATDTTTYINRPSRPMIGANGNGSGNLPFNGYISDVRCLKGTALYTSSFTPPTAPLTAITNTQLLLNCTNGAIFDNAMMNDLETVGNAQISTSVVKYGTGSIALDGSGDYLTDPPSPNLALAGNFTVEAWVYLPANIPNSLGGYLTDFRGGSTNNFALGFIGDSSVTKMYAYVGSGPTGVTGTATVTLNAWHHVAYVRNGSTVTMYLDGTSCGTMSTSFAQGPTNVVIGARYNGAQEYITGYIDELRITKGYARYTANFTPPSASFSDK